MTKGYVDHGAIVSVCGKYRYRLWREWRGTASRENWTWWTNDDGSPCLDGAGQQIGEPKSVLFVMLNPSTADGDVDDPTIRRCVGFAKHWKYDRLEVVNLFAYRATNPESLLKLDHTDDPVGEQNLQHVRSAVDRAGLIVCAWGNHGRHIGQDETMLGWLGSRRRYALRISKDGNPAHPLYLPLNSELLEFRP